MRLHVESTTASQPSASSRASAAGAGRVDSDALAQLDGCLAVRDADEGEPHEAKWVRGRTIATRANPATSRTANRRPRSPVSRRSEKPAA